jgi:O-acetyl-ADP-ribose deacetylase (regulator of RNase III)
MINVKVGNLLQSEAQTLVNTVNCVGVMGKGIALEFKQRYPQMFRDYKRRCTARGIKLGRPYLYKDLVGKWILNFPTKDHWRSAARLQDIVEGLEYLQEHYQSWGIRSLAVPPLGCGQGQLEWRIVGPTLYRCLCRLDIPVELYAPCGGQEQHLTREFLSQAPAESLVGAGTLRGSKINLAWLALVEIVARVTREPHHRSVGQMTFLKIAYFATAAGLPTGLQFAQGSHGPFASDLEAIITTLVNQGLIEEEKGGQMSRIRPGRTFADARQLARTEIEEWDDIIENVADRFLPHEYAGS